MAEGIVRSDREIRQAVFRELQSSGKVRDTEVGVEVEGGVVTLIGTVESLEKKIAAERAAHRTRGVLDVRSFPAGYALSLAKEADARLTLLHVLEWLPNMTEGRRSLEDRMFFGSTAHHVVCGAACPVLSVRPTRVTSDSQDASS